MRILLIEDERAISRFIQRGLREEGHVVDVAGDCESATQTLCDGSYDLLLVDRMLPDGDGLSVVRALRRDGDHTPAICITARDRIDERVEGLYGGADDYLIKPFAFDELLARIAAVVRRSGTTGRIEIGDLIVDIEAHRAWRAGDELKLTAQEFTLLRYLAENTGRVLSRTRILERVWDMHHDPGTNIVDVYISYLRQKLDRGHVRPLIHTVRGVGYMLEDSPG